MEVIKGEGSYDLIFIRFDPGEGILENINKIIKGKNIKTGIVISGIGSLSVCRIHGMNAGNPPNLLNRYKEYYEIKGAIELSSIQGVIADQKPHLHIVASKGKEVLTGHMEEGCTVFSFAEVVILKTDAINLIRKMHYPENIEQLTKLL
ncbi:MAG: hypothetical protein A2163_10455 [Actinobacteria bacterium RBG_13_35_12]|uniref:PPC domain-containing protein n=1 Tax=Candidatus Sediminicultor quintus TaxID=1797291 RepID=A0A1F5A5U0_9BACT|nr:MAG: hypothetical protein A2163_10455 [Actinobacteria bacterium RBG_13_35_12]OGD13922.1 MAG: hypothetical protein A2V47_03760 [Candidatus Atribacteria bacterium RBG_19FT_COMBO_35_14]